MHGELDFSFGLFFLSYLSILTSSSQGLSSHGEEEDPEALQICRSTAHEKRHRRQYRVS
jgi:hypothetical protein